MINSSDRTQPTEEQERADQGRESQQQDDPEA